MIEGLPAELAARLTPAALEALAPEDRAEVVEAVEAVRAGRARESLIDYAQFVDPGYFAAEVHRRIASILERLADPNDPLDRAMINVRPRIGKSELASTKFPAWYLGKYPNKQIIAASWGDDLASQFGRRVRNVMEAPAHAAVFPDARIAPDTRSAGQWETTAGGVYVAQGIEGGIIGFGADLLILDDVIRGYFDATSATKQERLWEWWQSDAQSRLHPGSAVLIINTRWTENDLCGRLIAEMVAGGEQWEIFDLPAIDADGVPLWPERFTPGWVERERRNTLPHVWEAAYMCNPLPPGGILFDADNLRYFTSQAGPDGKPIPMRIYGASDWATTYGGGDWTVHAVFGITPAPDEHIYLLDLYRKQVQTDVATEALLDLAARWKPIYWMEETAQIERSVGPFIRKRMQERRVYFSRYQVSSARDKVVKAQAFLGRFNMGKLHLPQNAPWCSTVVAELLKFPNGKHDDVLDACSILCRALPRLFPGQAPPPPPEPVQGVIISFPGAGPMGGDVRAATWDDLHEGAGIA